MFRPLQLHRGVHTPPAFDQSSSLLARGEPNVYAHLRASMYQRFHEEKAEMPIEWRKDFTVLLMSGHSIFLPGSARRSPVACPRSWRTRHPRRTAVCLLVPASRGQCLARQGEPHCPERSGRESSLPPATTRSKRAGTVPFSCHDDCVSPTGCTLYASRTTSGWGISARRGALWGCSSPERVTRRLFL